MPKRPLTWIVGVAALCGCGPLPLESEYSHQRAICSMDEAALFDELVEDCRARWEQDGSACAGVLGFEGSIEGVAVIVESELVRTEFDERGVPGAVTGRAGVSMIGASPYFQFSLSLQHVGGSLSDDPVLRTYVVPGPSDVYDDELVSAAIRLSTGAESNDRNSFGGELVITRQSATEQVGRFRFELGGDDEIEGCFHAFGTDFEYKGEDTSSDP